MENDNVMVEQKNQNMQNIANIAFRELPPLPNIPIDNNGVPVKSVRVDNNRGNGRHVSGGGNENQLNENQLAVFNDSMGIKNVQHNNTGKNVICQESFNAALEQQREEYRKMYQKLVADLQFENLQYQKKVQNLLNNFQNKLFNN